MRSFVVGGSSVVLVAASLVGVGCGPSPEPADAASSMDAGPPGAPDANRDAFRVTGDPFDNYADGLTGARTQECECTWRDDGFKTRDACVDDQLTNGDYLDCAREGYMAARSGSAPYYECASAAFVTYASCRMSAGCGDNAAITECVNAVQATLSTCGDLPEEAQTAFDTCFQRDFIGPASTCPEAASWMGVGTFMGDTSLAGNDTNPPASCFEGGMFPDTLEVSPERAYRWIAPSAGRFLIDTAGSEFDTILYVASACDATTYVACNDDTDAGAMIYTSSVTVEATAAGQEFIVIVDGYSVRSSGAFTVTVTASGPAPDAGMMGGDAGVMGGDAGPAGGDAGVADDAYVAGDAFAG
ncbi:MAG: hypothetical protein K1X94_25985 [Sandaracinaceae bacterium]|nr:hypothetical protein [Sandaracinaceae bacterium]